MIINNANKCMFIILRFNFGCLPLQSSVLDKFVIFERNIYDTADKKLFSKFNT